MKPFYRALDDRLLFSCVPLVLGLCRSSPAAHGNPLVPARCLRTQIPKVLLAPRDRSFDRPCHTGCGSANQRRLPPLQKNTVVRPVLPRQCLPWWALRRQPLTSLCALSLSRVHLAASWPQSAHLQHRWIPHTCATVWP